MPDDVNAHVMYCDATRDAFRFRATVDLDVLRRGLVLAQAAEKDGPWGRLLHALATHLWVRAGQEPAAVAELKAVVATAETKGWSNPDLAAAMCYLIMVLTNDRQYDEALATVKRARVRFPTVPEPVGRGIVARVVRATTATPPVADDTWLPEALAETEQYFDLLSRAAERDEHVTHSVIWFLSPVLELRGRTAEAEAMCARALRLHLQTQAMPSIACRRVLLLCRLEAPMPVLAQAVEEAMLRLKRQADGLELMGASQESSAVRARQAAIEEGKALLAGVREGTLARAEVASRLAAVCRPANILFDLMPVVPAPMR